MIAKRLLNKVAIVTGSTDGIGYGIAERLLKDGSKVVISSRKSENVEKALRKLRNNYDSNYIRGVVCHVGHASDRKNLITEAVSNFGKIDIVVSNVGTNVSQEAAMNCTEEAWDKMFDTNLKSGFFLVKDSLPHLNKNSSIIFNSAIDAYNPLKLTGVYSIAKTALLGMVKVLSQELADSPLSIRVNGIAPGLIKTKFSNWIHGDKTLLNKHLKEVFLKRIGTVEDCAGVVAFLASEDAAYITGETIVVAGGMLSRL